MQGVGPGSVLGDRYLVAARVSVHPRFERWTASDLSLERDVVVLCFPTDRGTAAAAVDSARRAAGIEEVRLVRVLDVGESDGVSYVVEEPLAGARSLTALAGSGGLPSEEARRLIGEAASALETARIRGLHHGALGPRSLLVLGDGAIKVRGLATEAALLGIDETSSRTALRTDAVALVALMYAALTGRWPLPLSVPSVDPGLEAAPTVGAGVAAPTELASGVPPDLDTLARLTFNHDQGPRSPGDLAAQIAPWSPTAYAAVLARPTGTPAATPAAPAVSPVPAAGSPAAGPPPAGAPPAESAARATAPLRRPRGRTVLGMALGGAAPDAAPAATAATAGEATGELGTQREHPASGALPAGEAAAGRGDVDEVDGPRPDRGPSPIPVTREAGAMRIIEDVRLSDTLEAGDDEPPVPIGSGGSALGRDQSKLALLVVAVLVIVAAVIGVANLSRGGSAPPQSVSTTASVPAPAKTSPEASAAPTTPTATAAPSSDIAITNAQPWDPQGDGQEGNASAPRAYDGNPATVWQSQTYASANFGGYPKSGIGLVLDLGQETEVHRVMTTLRGGADFTVYVANRLSLDGATSLGSSSGQDGDVTLAAPGGSAKGTLVILWFTKLARDSSGGFSAQVAEVKVS